MKLALSIIFLISLMSSCEASVSAANTRLQCVNCSADLPQYLPLITPDQDHSNLFFSEPSSVDFSIEDIEEEEDKDNFSLRKCKLQGKYSSASEQVIKLSRFHNDHMLPAPAAGCPPVPKYITQGTLRIWFRHPCAPWPNSRSVIHLNACPFRAYPAYNFSQLYEKNHRIRLPLGIGVSDRLQAHKARKATRR